MKEIICISPSLRILKLLHLKELWMVFSLHLKEVLAMRVIMGHRASSCVPSRVLSNCWRLLIAQNFVFHTDLSGSCLSIVVAHDITYWCSRSIRSTIWVLLFWQIYWLFLNLKIESWQSLFTSISSVSGLCSCSCCSTLQWIPVSNSEIVFVLWDLAIIVCCPNGGY